MDDPYDEIYQKVTPGYSQSSVLGLAHFPLSDVCSRHTAMHSQLVAASRWTVEVC